MSVEATALVLHIAEQSESDPEDVGPIEDAIAARLRQAGMDSTPNAVVAVATARRMDRATNDTGASWSALSKELRELMRLCLAKELRPDDPLQRIIRQRRARMRVTFDEQVDAGNIPASTDFEVWYRGR